MSGKEILSYLDVIQVYMEYNFQHHQKKVTHIIIKVNKN